MKSLGPRTQTISPPNGYGRHTQGSLGVCVWIGKAGTSTTQHQHLLHLQVSTSCIHAGITAKVENENLPPPVASTKKRRTTPTRKAYDTFHPPRQVPLTWGEHLPWRPSSPGKDHKRATATNNGAGRRYRNEHRKIRVMTSLVSSHHPARCGSDALGGLTTQSRPPLSAFPPNTSRDPRVLDLGLSGEILTPNSSEITCTPSLSTTPASSGSLNLRSGSRWEHVPRCSNTDWARRREVCSRCPNGSGGKALRICGASVTTWGSSAALLR